MWLDRPDRVVRRLTRFIPERDSVPPAVLLMFPYWIAGVPPAEFLMFPYWIAGVPPAVFLMFPYWIAGVPPAVFFWLSKISIKGQP